ncbi:hypothetical protein ACFWXE_10450 [[Kitasatospora] papulosa]|uniref:hypothetical protein n=1 Tax=[Kitasatospora] papulosa TaxID=1464011 RepID=UPI0036CE444F
MSSNVPQQGSRRDRYPRRQQSDIEFRPVRNGMDYLLSAVQHLTAGQQPPGERDLKYAVLHLHAATEVLLKARLVRDHWSLVIADVSKATEAKFRAGDFNSVTVEAAIDRLRNLAGLDIGQTNRMAIKALTGTRNALTHYGHAAPAYAVETQITKVLSFLLDFIPTHLYDPQSTSQFGAEYHDTMEAIRERLGRIDSLVKDRMGDVRADLKGMDKETVSCPHCQQYAVEIPRERKEVGEQSHAPATELSCRFCTARWSPTELAERRVSEPEFVGYSTQCPCWDSTVCADDTYSLVVGISTLAEPEASMKICFRCGAQEYFPLQSGPCGL